MRQKDRNYKWILILIVLTLQTNIALAMYSEFIRITPQNMKHNRQAPRVTIQEVTDNPHQLQITVQILQEPIKTVWLIVTKKPVSAQRPGGRINEKKFKQNFREVIGEGKDGGRGVVEKIVLFDQDDFKTAGSQERLEKAHKKFLLDKSKLNRAYIFQDEKSEIMDGGSYDTVDLNVFFNQGGVDYEK
ncbi:MAG: hypothetical protein JNN05_04745 [Candidatus Omnitrophica bacterium]|nr:hypothetical protein [Candidatus Omnitrophota bacterium]